MGHPRAATLVPPWEALARTLASRTRIPGLGLFSYILFTLKSCFSPGPLHCCPSTGGPAWQLQTGQLQEVLAHPHSSLGWPWTTPATSHWPKLCPWLEMAAREGQGRYIHGPWEAAQVWLQRLVVSTVSSVPSCAVDFQMSISIFTSVCYKHPAFRLHTNVRTGCPTVATWAVTERSHSGRVQQSSRGIPQFLLPSVGATCHKSLGLVHKIPKHF